MATAAKKVELTKWFKPENYNVLKEITVLQLCQEIRKRKAMFEELEEADSTPKCNAKPPILALQTPQTVA